MDPPRMMMNDATFQSSNEASFSMAEIWKFPVNAGCVNDGDKLELRKFQLEQSFGQFEGNLNVNRDVSIDDPMVLDQRAYSGGGNTKRHDEGDSGKGVSTSSGGNVNGGNGMNYIDIKRLKTLGSRDENDEPNDDMEANSGKRVEKHMKPAEQPKQDYIHVRARRGQATDSHSLAERARREKISERMRILQDLVPGCNKVIGKALVLDEIINYIQSLQRQVEFLSMKLEAVNSRPNPSMEGYSSSDFGQHAIDMAGVAFGSQASKEYNRGSSPDWLHMQIGGGFERT